MKWFKMLMIGAALWQLCAVARADEIYPSQPIRIVVTIGAGSAADILARIVGDELSRQLGQPVIVDDRPGAGGNIAADLVAKSAPNGYTLLMASISTHGINPALYKKLSFDPVKDFEPVCLLAENPNVLVVAPGLPVRSVKDLIELARARPGALTFSSGGSGTSQHLAGEMLAIATGTRLLHVPYKSTPQSVNAVLAGEVDMTFASVPVALPHVQGGKVRALAVTSARPVSMWPDLPTLASQGVPAFDVSAWFGLMAPAGTPRPIVDRLNAALVRILEMPSVKDKLRAQGMQPLGGSPSDFGSKVKSEIDRWGTVVRSAGVTLN